MDDVWILESTSIFEAHEAGRGWRTEGSVNPVKKLNFILRVRGCH